VRGIQLNTETVEYQQGTLEVREITLTADGEDVVTLESQYLNQHRSDETPVTARLQVQHT